LQLSAAASKHLSTLSFVSNLTNAVPIQHWQQKTNYKLRLYCIK